MLIRRPKILIADIETNAIKDPTHFWVLGVVDYHTDEFTSYVGDDAITDGLFRLLEADCVIGHNFIQYDAKNIKAMTDGLVEIPKAKIIDTLSLSRRYVPELSKDNGGDGHSLGVWGEIFDFPKGDWKKFDKFYPEMVPYCERDCRIAKKIFDFTNSLSIERTAVNLLEHIL